MLDTTNITAPRLKPIQIGAVTIAEPVILAPVMFLEPRQRVPQKIPFLGDGTVA